MLNSGLDKITIKGCSLNVFYIFLLIEHLINIRCSFSPIKEIE